MSWAHSLIRIRSFDIETLRKRLATILENRQAAERSIQLLDEEGEAEMRHARANPEAALCLPAFRRGWAARRRDAEAHLKMVQREEQGCRDALMDAFADLKKVEAVASSQDAAEARAVAQRETAELNEIALRGSRVSGRHPR
jgi:hypothetical protein